MQYTVQTEYTYLLLLHKLFHQHHIEAGINKKNPKLHYSHCRNNLFLVTGNIMHTKVWSENLKERDHSEDLGIDGKIISEHILGNKVGRCGMDASGSGYRPVAGSCEHGNEILGSIRGGEFD
jgi:hypothetical protein